MAIKSLKLKLTGLKPLLMHNGNMLDPQNPYVIAMKKITSKRKKVDADLEELSRLEFLGGLYLDENNNITIPPEVINGVLKKAAKLDKMGKKMESGVMCKNTVFTYEGPKDIDKLYKCGGFVDRRRVKLGQSAVMRTRPIFKKWSVVVELEYNEESIDKSDILKAAGYGMSFVGIGDWKEIYGKFSCEEI